jgi:catalase-peroxidase
MGPIERFLGPEVPSEELIWMDPIPKVDFTLIDDADVVTLKDRIKDTGLSVSELVSVGWASASTYRDSDKRGGANGARIRLLPQRNWPVNNPPQLKKTLDALEGVRKEFNDAQSGNKAVSLADLIVLAGNVGVEQAAAKAGHAVTIPFTPGRNDARQDQTDVESFHALEPVADGFRNYTAAGQKTPAERLLVDRANLLTLSPPEMTALVGGLRVLGANYDGSEHGVFTDRVGTLSTDFFTNVVDLGTKWAATDESETTFVGTDRRTGEQKRTGTRVDLIFGSNSELRAIAEVYASSDGEQQFIDTFVSAWNKIMMADRFDLN